MDASKIFDISCDVVVIGELGTVQLHASHLALYQLVVYCRSLSGLRPTSS